MVTRLNRTAGAPRNHNHLCLRADKEDVRPSWVVLIGLAVLSIALEVLLEELPRTMVALGVGALLLLALAVALMLWIFRR